MSIIFTHYLITRYNVTLEGWHIDKSGRTTGDNAWLTHRYELFTQYCIPTILIQSEKNFTWIIYCDRDTPVYHLDEISKSISSIPQAKIKLTTGYYDCLKDIDRTLAVSGTSFVITSRLDNDDGIGKDYIKTIQEHFTPQDGTMINLFNGHGYNPLNKVATRMYNMHLNHFTSLIERTQPNGGHISIRGFQHDSPPPHFNIINIPAKNGWLKIFHDRNLRSSIFGYPLFLIDLNSLYGIDKNHSKINYYRTFIYSIWWLMDGCKRKLRHALNQSR